MIKQANTLLIVLMSFLLAFWLRFGYSALPQSYLVALLLTLFLCAISFPATGTFRAEFEWAFMCKLRRLVGAGRTARNVEDKMTDDHFTGAYFNRGHSNLMVFRGDLVEKLM